MEFETKMKKEIQIWAIVALVCVIAALAYTYWPQYPYKVGSCVEDIKLLRVYEVTGPLDRFHTGEVPVVIRKNERVINGLYLPGTITSIEKESENHRVVPCP